MSQNLWDTFEHLKLEYAYRDFQKKITDKLRETKKNDLKRYKKLRIRDCPSLIQQEDQEDLVRQNTIFLRNSHEFWKAAQEVTEFIRPVLYHYSFQQFNAFFIYTMFKWPMLSRGHGVRCLLSDDLSETKIVFRETGFFKRLLDTFIVLGRPTAYGPWIPIGSQEGTVFRDNTVDLRMPTDKVKLTDLLDFKPHDFMKKFAETYPDAYYDRGLDYRLTDYLVVFIASNTARYRPSLWREVIYGSGEIEARFNQRLRTAYVNYEIEYLETVHSEFEKWRS